MTTQGVVGLEEDGRPRFVEQAYDNATKVVSDRSNTTMAMVAGPANIGQVAATDFISKCDLPLVQGKSLEAQDARVREFISDLVAQKREYWETTAVPAEDWPGPTILLAAPAAAGIAPESGGSGWLAGTLKWKRSSRSPASDSKEPTIQPSHSFMVTAEKFSRVSLSPWRSIPSE